MNTTAANHSPSKNRPAKVVESTTIVEKKKRGRPAKVKEEPAPTTVVEKKKRGRPAKVNVEPVPAPTPSLVEKEKKKRGRPAKVKEEPAPTAPVVKTRRRGGGRPITTDDPVNKLRREKWRARKDRLLVLEQQPNPPQKRVYKPRVKKDPATSTPKTNARIVLGVLKPSTVKEYPKEAYVSSREACMRLAVHNCTLHSWQKKGLIEGYRDNQRMWVYNVARFLEETDMVHVPIDAVFPLIEKRPYAQRAATKAAA